MNPTRRQLMLALAACSVLPMSACQRNARTFSRDKIVAKYTMKTYPAGRFLIDLPVIAKDFDWSLKIFGDDIEWRASSEPNYQRMVEQRIRELKGTDSTAGLLLREDAGNTPKTRIIVFEEKSTRDGFIGYEGYRYYDAANGYFVVKGMAPRRDIEELIPEVKRIFRLIETRAPDAAEIRAGICGGHAFIGGTDPKMFEQTALSVNVGELSIAFSTQVINRIVDDDSPLQRGELIKDFPEAKLLRKSRRTVAALDGAELGFVDIPQANSKYSLVWEYPGQVNSITAPQMSVSMNSQGPLSIPQDEVLGLWDVILESIRMRPSAV